AAGLSPGTGPYRVITDLAVLGYHEETKRMQVLSLHPGVTLERVREATGFSLECAEPLTSTAVPTQEELCILREEVDPHRYVIGRLGRGSPGGNARPADVRRAAFLQLPSDQPDRALPCPCNPATGRPRCASRQRALTRLGTQTPPAR